MRRAFVVCLSATSVMTAMDYECQPASHLAFRCADLVAVPEVFPLDRLLAQGARPGRTWRYPGLKEHIALADFTPDPGSLGRAGIEALDGRQLVAGADAVVSAGGSLLGICADTAAS